MPGPLNLLLDELAVCDELGDERALLLGHELAEVLPPTRGRRSPTGLRDRGLSLVRRDVLHLVEGALVV